MVLKPEMRLRLLEESPAGGTTPSYKEREGVVLDPPSPKTTLPFYPRCNRRRTTMIRVLTSAGILTTCLLSLALSASPKPQQGGGGPEPCNLYEDPKNNPAGCYSGTITCEGEPNYNCCSHYHDTLSWHICRTGGIDAQKQTQNKYYKVRVETCGTGSCNPGSFATCTHYERDCRTKTCPE
jgi:hypothetical protein